MEFDVNYTHSRRACTAGIQTRIHTLPRHLQFILKTQRAQTGRRRSIRGTRPAGREAPTTSSSRTPHRQGRWEGAQARRGCSQACPGLRGLCAGQRGACVRPASAPGPKPGVSLVPTPRLPDELGRSPPPQAPLPADEPGTPTKAPPPRRVAPWW